MNNEITKPNWDTVFRNIKYDAKRQNASQRLFSQKLNQKSSLRLSFLEAQICPNVCITKLIDGWSSFDWKWKELFSCLLFFSLSIILSIFLGYSRWRAKIRCVLVILKDLPYLPVKFLCWKILNYLPRRLVDTKCFNTSTIWLSEISIGWAKIKLSLKEDQVLQFAFPITRNKCSLEKTKNDTKKYNKDPQKKLKRDLIS